MALTPSIRVKTLFKGLVLAICASVGAQPLRAAFDPLGYGAEAQGMGGAYTAAVDNGSAAYWNPAALATVTHKEVAGSFQDIFGLGILRYTTLGYTHPGLAGGTFGFHLLRLQTTGDARFLTYAENTFIVSHGRPLGKSKRFFIGGNMRYYWVAADTRGAGLGFDTSLLYRSTTDRWRIGFTVQDINEPRIRWENGTRDILPPLLRLGLRIKVGPVSEVSVQEDWRRHEGQDYRVGMAHYLMNRKIALRGGLSRNERQDEWTPAVGLGLLMGLLNFNYGWEQNTDLGVSQNFSVIMRFGP